MSPDAGSGKAPSDEARSGAAPTARPLPDGTKAPGPGGLKAAIGDWVKIERRDGEIVIGVLQNVTRRSVWLLDGQDDLFIAAEDIAAWSRA